MVTGANQLVRSQAEATDGRPAMVRLIDLVPDDATLDTYPFGEDAVVGHADHLVRRTGGFDRLATGLTWATLTDVHLLIEPGFDGVIYLHDGRILLDSHRFTRPDAAEPMVAPDGVLPSVDQLPGGNRPVERIESATVPFNPGWRNYYHWLLQCLPGILHATDVLDRGDVVVPDPASFRGRPVGTAFSRSVFIDSLSTVSRPGENVRILSPGLYRVDRLRLLKTVNRRDHNPLFDTAFGPIFSRRLATTSLTTASLTTASLATASAAPVAGSPPAARRRRLHIRRNGATNEARTSAEDRHLLDALADDAGFEPILLEDFSFAQQIELFASAGVVLGAHGAGLANLIFATNATVFEYAAYELNSPHERMHFQILSRQLGHSAYLFDRPALTAHRSEVLDALVTGHP